MRQNGAPILMPMSKPASPRRAPRSPFAPQAFAALPRLKGVALSTHASGSFYRGRDDVLLMRFAPGTQAAGLFTRSSLPAAAVSWCRAILPHGRARLLIANAGNANAHSGAAGARAVARLGQEAAQLLDCSREEIYQASTGRIGAPLEPEPLLAALRSPHALRGEAQDWERAARALMTTDTYPKGASVACEFLGQRVHINGIAKGAGMIAPNMATLLAFLVTDAALPAPLLQALLAEHAPTSFNAILVDGDESTNDSCLLFATGGAGERARLSSPQDAALTPFRDALGELMQRLARQLICDAEGISKLLHIHVCEAASPAQARRIALSIAASPLVKTAFAGAEPNWGRIVMAIGKSGETVAAERLRIRLGAHEVAAQGGPMKVDAAALAAACAKREIRITVALGLGAPGHHASILASDLTADYVRINADYLS